MKFKIGDVVYRDTEDGIDIIEVVEIANLYIIRQVNQYNSPYGSFSIGQEIELSFDYLDKFKLLPDELKAEVL
jgi:hypothetical protein